MGKNRKYIISWNNYPKDLTLEELKNKILKKGNVEYLILGFEIGEQEHTPHIQGYVKFTNPISFDSFHKIFKNDDGTLGWIKEANGSDLKNQEYCSKQGNYLEYGTPKEDEDHKEDLYNQLVEDIINEFPFIELCRKYSKYVCFHYRDFKQLYQDINNLNRDKKQIDNIKRIENELGIIIKEEERDKI